MPRDTPTQPPVIGPVAPATAAAVTADPQAGDGHGGHPWGALFAATLCFVIWGTVPLFWRELGHVGTDEIIAHRALWSGVFILAILLLRRGGAQVFAQPRRIYGMAFLSALFVSTNWGIFIWAVNAGRVLETSLGYFLSPLVMAVFGMIFFDERLRRARMAALLLAVAGVANLVVRHAGVPWVALGLCLTWGAYSVVRKKMAMDPVLGLVLECWILAPFAVAWLVWLHLQGGTAFLTGTQGTRLLLMAGGLVSVVPLVAFAAAARRMPLTALAFLQFITPTLTFLLGVFVFDEGFDPVRAVTFALIWAGVIVFVGDSMRTLRRRGRS